MSPVWALLPNIYFTCGAKPRQVSGKGGDRSASLPPDTDVRNYRIRLLHPVVRCSVSARLRDIRGSRPHRYPPQFRSCEVLTSSVVHMSPERSDCAGRRFPSVARLGLTSPPSTILSTTPIAASSSPSSMVIPRARIPNDRPLVLRASTLRTAECVGFALCSAGARASRSVR